MADLAKMRIAVDSTDVRKGAADLDRFGNTAKTSSSSIDRLYASQSKLEKALISGNKQTIQATRYLDQMQRELATVGKSAMQIKAIEINMAAASAPTEELARDIRKVGAELLKAERNAARSSGGMMRLGSTNRLAAHHTQNLAFQLQDVAVGLQGGQRPMTVLMQQGSQIGGIMMQAGIGVKQLGKEIVGMIAMASRAVLLNPYFLAIAGVIGVVSGAVKLMASDISKSSGVSVTATDVMLGAFDVLRDAVSNKVSAAFEYFGTSTGEVLDYVVKFARNFVNTLIGLFTSIPRAIAKAFEVIPEIVSKVFSGDFSGALDTALGAALDFRAGTFQRDYIGEMSSVLGDAATKRAVQRIAEESGDDVAKGVANGVAKGLSESEELLKSLTDVLNSTRAEIASIGETPLETKLRELNDAASRAAAEGFTDLSIELRQVAIELSNATRAANDLETFRENLDEQSATAEKAGQELRNLNAELEHEISLLGMSAAEREAAIEKYEEEAIVLRFAAQHIGESNEALQRYLELRRQRSQRESAIAKDAEEAEKLREGLEAVFDILGRNGIGGVLSGVLRIQVRGDENQLVSLGDKILEGLGELGKTFVTAIQYAATGGLVGGAAGSALGGSIGGAIGGKLGEKFLEKGLDSVFKGLGGFAGPIGSIAGGLLGGIIGGMVKSTPRASATIETISGNAMVSSVRGNKSQLKQMAEGLAGSVVNGLQKIAEEFSGTIADGLKISIGVRKKTFRVDPLGLGRTKGMIAFDTEEEAIRYAIKLALERGAIEGIRQSTQNLLQAGDDLEAALQEAMDFEGVFDRLLEKTDPLTHGLKELDKEFERLNKIFEKAGATTEEYAELQRLYDLERADILKEEQQRQMDEANKINNLIMRIYKEQGKEAEELALTRKMERDAATEAERAILDQIYALEDFNKARVEEVSTLEDTIATMTQLAGSLRAFREGLYGADQSVMNYKQALVDLIRVGSLASTGDVEALGQLQGVSQTFLASSKASARSLFDYQKDVALVASYVDQGIAAADEQVSAAEQQIDLLQQQLDELVNIAALLEQPTTPDVAIDPSWNANIAGGGGGNTATLPVDGSDMQAMLSEALYAIAKNTGNTAKLLDRWDGDGQPDIRELQSDYY